jgi:predicted nucleotidyltransferase
MTWAGDGGLKRARPTWCASGAGLSGALGAERLWKVSPKPCYVEHMATIVDPVLSRFRAALDEVYGERIERVVLFGSRARGDARPDSDYDVAVFLKNLNGFGKEAGRIAEIEADILTETGAVINAMPLQAGSYRDRTGLMGELRRDGLDL